MTTRATTTILFLVLIPSLALFWGSARAVPSSLPDPELESMVWYSELHYEVNGMVGDWRVRSADSVTRFRPVAGATAIQLLELQSGQVIERPIPPEGEVVLGHGWIVVDVAGNGAF